MQYAAHIGMPRGRRLPFLFGMRPRRSGLGRSPRCRRSSTPSPCFSGVCQRSRSTPGACCPGWSLPRGPCGALRGVGRPWGGASGPPTGRGGPLGGGPPASPRGVGVSGGGGPGTPCPRHVPFGASLAASLACRQYRRVAAVHCRWSSHPLSLPHRLMLAVVTLPHGQLPTLAGEATWSRGLSHHRIPLVARLGRALVAEHQAAFSLRVQQLLMRLRVAAQPLTTTTTL